MRSAHLALVATSDRGRLEHPVEDPASVVRVFGWLSPLVPNETTWHVEEVA